MYYTTSYDYRRRLRDLSSYSSLETRPFIGDDDDEDDADEDTSADK
jgi:hypothetical protein